MLNSCYVNLPSLSHLCAGVGWRPISALSAVFPVSASLVSSSSPFEAANALAPTLIGNPQDHRQRAAARGWRVRACPRLSVS